MHAGGNHRQRMELLLDHKFTRFNGAQVLNNRTWRCKIKRWKKSATSQRNCRGSCCLRLMTPWQRLTAAAALLPQICNRICFHMHECLGSQMIMDRYTDLEPWIDVLLSSCCYSGRCIIRSLFKWRFEVFLLLFSSLSRQIK
ncbi:hypothetical protein NC651_031807 [Populus alba x Populus x berolinensis]|nr:hypothetical protein NC651_031807 [Populus alba x Populus x berolinensis]